MLAGMQSPGAEFPGIGPDGQPVPAQSLRDGAHDSVIYRAVTVTEEDVEGKWTLHERQARFGV
jgi:hypothetical protein